MLTHNATRTDCLSCGVTVMVYQNTLYTPVSTPLLTGEITADGSSTPAFRTAYLPHQCDPRDIDTFQHQRHHVQALIAQHHPGALAAQHSAEHINQLHGDAAKLRRTIDNLITTHGLTRPCPKCDVPVGEPCHNLNARKQQRTEYTKNPHEQRLPLPDQASIYDIAIQHTKLQALQQRIVDAEFDMSRDQLIQDIAAALQITLPLTERPSP